MLTNLMGEEFVLFFKWLIGSLVVLGIIYILVLGGKDKK